MITEGIKVVEEEREKGKDATVKGESIDVVTLIGYHHFPIYFSSNNNN